jgi:two-component system, NtrC family, nitrogen regulation response regulator NtrX
MRPSGSAADEVGRVAAGGSVPDCRPARVLVLEDDAELRGVLCEVLQDEGFEVATCDSYAALRGGVAQAGSTIVLADFWGVSHAELSSAERDEIRELGGQVRTILLTGRAWISSVDAADLNLICILPKPVVLDDLIAQIRRCLTLARHRAERSV